MDSSSTSKGIEEGFSRVRMYARSKLITSGKGFTHLTIHAHLSTYKFTSKVFNRVTTNTHSNRSPTGEGFNQLAVHTHFSTYKGTWEGSIQLTAAAP